MCASMLAEGARMFCLAERAHRQRNNTKAKHMVSGYKTMTQQLAHQNDRPHLMAFINKHAETRACIIKSAAISKGGA